MVRFYSVMVSTQDFESCNPGSNPGRTFAPLAQRIARWTSNPKVAGSNPAGSMGWVAPPFFFLRWPLGLEV